MALIFRVAQADRGDEGETEVGEASTEGANGRQGATVGEERIFCIVGLKDAEREWKLLRFEAILDVCGRLRVTCRPQQTLYEPTSEHEPPRLR